MSGTVQGHCNCSSVKVEIDSSVFPKQSLLCHLRPVDSFSTNLVVPSDEVKIVSGSEHIKEYGDRNTETGHTAARELELTSAMSSQPIRTYVAEAKETSYVKGGLFEPGQVPPPAMEIFKRRCEEWELLHGEVQAID
ncbi:hypothetical protein JCM21900_006914 [Sporobolomyces salmonicolor]